MTFEPKLLTSISNFKSEGLKILLGASTLFILWSSNISIPAARAGDLTVRQGDIQAYRDYQSFSTNGLLTQRNSSKVYTSINISDLEGILRASDLLYQRRTETSLRFDVDSYKILASLQGCGDNTSTCVSILLGASFTAPGNLNVVNEWNRLKRGSRAYLDTDGSLVLESDIDVIGGVTEEYLKLRIGMFALSVDSFAKHISQR